MGIILSVLGIFLAILGLIVSITFGILQLVAHSGKGEVKFSKRFPFVTISPEGAVPEEAVKKTRKRRRKKRSIRKILIPLFVVVVLVIALLRLNTFLRGELRQTTMAVMAFKNRTGESSFDYLSEAIPNLLITDLEQSKYLSVMTWERMHDLLKVMGKEDVEEIDEELAFELCKMEGIEAIVLGSFTKAGEMFATEAKVLDIETKKIRMSTSSKGEGKASILKSQIDELTRDISRGVGLSKRKIEETQRPIAEVTTTSVEAYNYFLRGRDDFEKYYLDDARRFLEKAVELDSTFASAYLYLAQAYDGLVDIKARNEAYEKAKILSEKATEKERLYIKAATEKNSEEKFRILKELAKKYPKEKRVHSGLGDYYNGKNLYSKAIQEYNKALELDLSYGYVINNLAYLYAGLDNFEKAIEYFQRYASVSPGDANPFDSMGDLYFRMGKLDEAIAKYKEALEVKPDFGSDWKIAYIYALKEDYTETMKWVDQFITMAPSPGKKAEAYFWKGYYNYWLSSFKQSLENLDRVSEWAEEAGSKFWKAYPDFVKGWIYYDQGELELSRRNYKSSFDLFLESLPSFKSSVTADFHFYFGLLDLKEGRIDSVKSKLSTMKSLLPEIDQLRRDEARYRHDLLSAAILLAQGSVENAIAACENITPLEIPSMSAMTGPGDNVMFLRDVLARAYQQKGEIDKAIAEYERLTTFDPKSKEHFLIPPRFHYKLAKLYEEKGVKAKAIAEYEKFLEIWKNADEDLPEPIDARKHLAKLKATR